MPELAEVEYFRKQWDAGMGRRVTAVKLHREKRVFRETDVGALVESLTSAVLRGSEAQAKRLLFRFMGGNLPRGQSAWLGIHPGMSGVLRVEAEPYAPDRHDHLVLCMPKCMLVFRDTRMFGRVRCDVHGEAPEYWRALPPPILSQAFTREVMGAFLRRRAKAPVKAVLLMQERFPGVGNWMADEILWRARVHPAARAGDLSPRQVAVLHRATRWVCRQALDIIGTDWSDPPDSWLFSHRWKDGGLCPRTRKPLVRETIGGRTTCYSPAWQEGQGAEGAERRYPKDGTGGLAV